MEKPDYSDILNKENLLYPKFFVVLLEVFGISLALCIILLIITGRNEDITPSDPFNASEIAEVGYMIRKVCEQENQTLTQIVAPEDLSQLANILSNINSLEPGSKYEFTIPITINGKDIALAQAEITITYSDTPGINQAMVIINWNDSTIYLPHQPAQFLRDSNQTEWRLFWDSQIFAETDHTSKRIYITQSNMPLLSQGYNGVTITISTSPGQLAAQESFYLTCGDADKQVSLQVFTEDDLPQLEVEQYNALESDRLHFAYYPNLHLLREVFGSISSLPDDRMYVFHNQISLPFDSQQEYLGMSDLWLQDNRIGIGMENNTSFIIYALTISASDGTTQDLLILKNPDQLPLVISSQILPDAPRYSPAYMNINYVEVSVPLAIPGDQVTSIHKTLIYDLNNSDPSAARDILDIVRRLAEEWRTLEPLYGQLKKYFRQNDSVNGTYFRSPGS